MQARGLIKKIAPHAAFSGGRDFIVRGISCDSRQVRPGHIFVAVKGYREDGAQHIEEALDRGAKMVLGRSLPDARRRRKGICYLRVGNERRALARLAAEFYGNPSAGMRVTGVTGTNGKTTVSYLIEAILKEKGLGCGVIGTVNYRFADTLIPAKNTTPGPLELQPLLARMLKAGIRYAAMEVSSHALAQQRVNGIDFSAAIFTNLTQDHLDYHRTMDNYFRCKAELFRGLSARAFAVLNNDDRCVGRIKKITRAKVVAYGIEKKSDIRARDIRSGSCGSEFTLCLPGKELPLKTRLIGRHNIYNLLAAAAWAYAEGIDVGCVENCLRNFSAVPGRLERANAHGKFSVFIDYAHTEDALRNVIISLRRIARGKIIVVFGCGGERDRLKRPKMGRVASGLSDYCVVTSDNPRSEEPEDIAADILRGVKKKNFSVILDRREAIRHAISAAAEGDIVLVAGKGHENYQIFKDKTLHFDDREIVKACLSSAN